MSRNPRCVLLQIVPKGSQLQPHHRTYIYHNIVALELFGHLKSLVCVVYKSKVFREYLEIRKNSILYNEIHVHDIVY